MYRGKKSYLSAAGKVLERSLYRAKCGKAICPLEMQAGTMDGYWTPLAARQGVWVSAQLPLAQGEALFREVIRALAYLKKKHPRRVKLATQ